MEYRYTEERHRMFSALSGDYNPMHVDPVAARRTLVGTRAVHGIHQTLAALDVLLASGNESGRGIAGFKSQFVKAVGVDDTVDYSVDRLTEEGCRITGRIGEEIVGKTTVRFGAPASSASIPLPPLVPESVIELSLEEIKDRTGSLPLGIDPSLAQKLFPIALTALGEPSLAAIVALSRLVGMQCPGLHSIFAEAVVDFADSGAIASIGLSRHAGGMSVLGG